MAPENTFFKHRFQAPVSLFWPFLRHLMATTALTFLLPQAVFAQQVIDGTTETVNGGGGGTQASPWNIGDTLTVGNSGTGTLEILNGGVVSNTEAWLGFTGSGNGTVTIDGAGSQWTSTDQLWVGYDGVGSMTISNGATASGTVGNIAFGTGATGTVVVTGSGSSWQNSSNMHISEGGTGYLTVSNGGTVSQTTFNSSIYIANDAGSYGETTVTGVGSSLASGTSGQLYVGYSGQGVLNIADSAVVTADNGYIGHFGTAVGTVTVQSNGSLDLSATGSDLTIGNQDGSVGTLNVQNSGLADVGDRTILGDRSGSQGTLNVTGSGSQFESRSLYVGDDGTGVLNVTGGGSVEAEFPMTVGVNAGSTGTVTNDDSTLLVGNTFTIGQSGEGSVTVQNSGYLGVTGGTQIGLNNGSVGALTVTGTGTIWSAGFDVYLGGEGTGTVTVSDSANANVSGGAAVYIATDAGGSGTLNVDNADFQTNGLVQVGVGGGTGTVNVSNAGEFYSETLTIGVSNGIGTVTVSSGSTLELDGGLFDMTVGQSGAGTLSIMGGASVTNDYTYLASETGSTGTVLVDGTGSSWTNTGEIYVGDKGTANLAVTGGGTVTSNGAYIGYDTSGIGTVSVDGMGSQWNSTASVTVGGDGTGVLTIANEGTVSLAGGTGTLHLADSGSSTGTLNIGAAATDTAMAAGTLNAASVVFDNGTGLIVFNHTNTDYEFDAVISGGGNVAVYSGETVLTGASTYTGATAVFGGLLTVNGSITGDVYLMGGTVGGSGSLGNVAVQTGGSVAPGNSIGTLNAVNVIFGSGSSYDVELNDGGFVAGTNNDLINVSGPMTIGGGTVNVLPENGTDDGSTYTLGTYTIATAAGGVSGTFDTVSDSFVFLDFLLSYDANNIYLTSLQSTALSDVAQTANQRAVAAAQEALGSGTTVYDALLGLVGNDATARAALDDLSGEIHPSARSVLIEDSRFAREAVNARIRAVFDNVAAVAIATHSGTGDPALGQDAARQALWVNVFGAIGTRDGDGNAATMDRTAGGIFFGGDYAVTETVRVGLIGGYSHAGIDVDARSSTGTVDGIHVGLYSGAQFGAIGLRGGGVYSWNSLDTSRTVAFTGFSETLTADYDARAFQLFGEAGYGIEQGRARIEPYAGLAYVHVNTDGFTETGGSSALTAASETTGTAFTTLGLRGETEVAFGPSMTARLGAGLAWRHAFGDVVTLTQMNFAGGGAFPIAGTSVARNSLLMELGADVMLNPAAALGLSYSGQIGNGFGEHGLNARLSVSF
jgi:subtilase-type serine protease